MASTYIARQAILDRKSKTIGYELLFRDSPENKFPEIDQDIATSKLIIQNHIHGDIVALSMGKTAFINFTEHCLVNKYPLMFDKNAIVIELVGHPKMTERLRKIVKYYFDNGYKIALTEYDVTDQWDAIFPYLSIIKVDIEKINPKRLLPLVKKIRDFDIKLVAEKVETRYQLQGLAEVGFNYFQGFFYHEPEIIEGQTLAPIKAQMLHLMSETFRTPLNYNAISDIISRDVNLSIGLLKMVNNVTTGTKIEITSLKQATTYLGEEKLKQFVSILALSKLSSDHTDEASKQALITGKMMEALSRTGEFSRIHEYAFITGLLSSIEVLLSMPMSEILKTMPLAEPIVAALMHQKGVLGELLSITTNYITGQDDKIKQQLQHHGITTDIIRLEFVEASKWCQTLEF
jgi:EAL and modified HD-GYP domain-containing signal transduction protein